MKKTIRGGVWPTMITPYTPGGEIDYGALERMVEWYVDRGVAGLFAVCQSSEMFFLSLEERVRLARFVRERAAGRVQVIASGHVSDDFRDQARELTLMAETGVDAVVLITNRLAGPADPAAVWRNSLERLLRAVPEEVGLGFYECPYPYKRLLSPEELKFCSDSGRFLFLKDTSCDIANIRAKLDAAGSGGLKIFNANAATLLETLKLGVSGFSGVMANFHPDLYAWLCAHWRAQPQEARRLANFLSLAALIERQSYPVNAKYHMNLEGVAMGTFSRARDHGELTETYKLEVRQLRELVAEYRERYQIQ